MIVRGEVLIGQGHRAAAYDSMGFVKVAHALGLHGVVVLPALAWLLARQPGSEERRRELVAYAVVAYALLTAGALAWGIVSVL
jgi:cation transporter-like permease